MPSLRELTDSLIAIWTESTPAARVGLIMMVVLCATMLTYVGIWSSQPTYVTLVSESDPDKISSIMNELEKEGIRFQLGGAGGVVSVDRQQFPRASVIAKKYGADENSSSSMGMDGMFYDRNQKHQLSVKQLQSQIEQSIEQLEQVRNATVLINKPLKAPFERAIEPNSASVTLRLERGAILTKENVFAIASTVANSVEKLELSRVNVTDTSGKVYTVSDGNYIGEHIEYTAKQENELAAKALTQLNKLYGPGNSDVQITLQYDFSRRKVDTVEFDSDKVVFHESIDSTESKGGNPSPLGAAGVDSNLSANSSTSGQANNESTTEKLESFAKVPSTTESTVDNTAKITSMTVAVAVNDQANGIRLEDGNVNPEAKQNIEQLVRSAVGFKDDYGTITVNLAPFFEPPEIEEVAEPFEWGFVNDILKNVSLAVASIVVLLLGMMTLRHFKPTQPTTNAANAGEQASHLQQLNDLATTNPELFQRILHSWLGEKPNQDSSKRTAA